jgi:hypothetical protein
LGGRFPGHLIQLEPQQVLCADVIARSAVQSGCGVGPLRYDQIAQAVR